MQRLTTLFILGILWHFQTFAQSFNGYVKDKDDTAMEWATVILKNVEESLSHTPIQTKRGILRWMYNPQKSR